MDIRTLDIRYIYTYAGIVCEQDGLEHRKSLPYLSVVQATEGSYDISLGGGPWANTGEGGAFIAPAAAMQDIIHRVSPLTGVMKAQWIFLDIRVNGNTPLDTLFDFPLLLPASFCTDLARHLAKLSKLSGEWDLCDRLSEAYQVIKLLLKAGKPRTESQSRVSLADAYIQEHYPEKLSPADLARALHMSVPSLYRWFHTAYGMTPANYINHFRLAQAALLLETTEKSLEFVGESIGIPDMSYFSRLFRLKYGLPPAAYRRQMAKPPAYSPSAEQPR